MIKKAQIIAAAQQVIARNGGFQVSIQNVAEAAGVSKGAVLHYFPTKSELFEAVFEDFFQQAFRIFEEDISKLKDPVKKLKTFAVRLYDAEDPLVPIGYPLFFECMYRAVKDEAFQAVFHDWISHWIDMLAEIIREGISQGKMREVDPLDTAKKISAVFQGVASRWYLDRSRHSTKWARKTVKDTIDVLVGKDN